MKVADNDVERPTVEPKTTRSRFHYKPISSAELYLTIALSTFIGIGVFLATVISPQTESATSQMLQSNIEADANLTVLTVK
ncbi:MAG: hypothetical protein AAFQ41_02410 [Cyanobacteria bacterium J06623_7]